MSAVKDAHVLFAFANESQLSNAYLHELNEERRMLSDIMDRNKQCYDQFVIEATARSVQANINKYDDKLIGFHFSGHAGKDRLLMEAEWRQKKYKPREVYNKGIAEALAKAPHIKFVFLNGCNSALKAIDFHKKGIPIVIGTQLPVRDDVAKEFAISFYGYMMDQKLSLKNAFDQAHITLKNSYENLNQMLLNREQVDGRIRDVLFDRKRIINTDVPYVIKVKPGFEHIQNEGISDWSMPSETPSNPPIAKIPTNAYLLCNRQKPSSQFDQKTTIRKPKTFRTSCFFIHGPAEELPDKLAQRFEELNLPKNLKALASQGLNSVEIRFPSQSDLEDYNYSYSIILDSLADELIEEGELGMEVEIQKLSMVAPKLEEILGKGGGKKALLVQHSLSKKDFHQGFTPFMKAYLREFWQAERFQFSIPVMILFRLEYPRATLLRFKDPSKDIENTLKEVERAIPTCTLLPKLDKVDYEDVRNWVRELQKSASLKKGPSKVRRVIEEVPEKVFKRKSGRTSMENILPILEEAIEVANEHY